MSAGFLGLAIFSPLQAQGIYFHPHVVATPLTTFASLIVIGTGIGMVWRTARGGMGSSRSRILWLLAGSLLFVSGIGMNFFEYGVRPSATQVAVTPTPPLPPAPQEKSVDISNQVLASARDRLRRAAAQPEQDLK